MPFTSAAGAGPPSSWANVKEAPVRVEANGVGIEYEVTGEGRPVVLLHGFPDSGRLWRNQVPALADAGFQVIVPDLRGYGRSDKPAEVQAYALGTIVGDVAAVIGDAGAERAHVVGHDWGAGVAWALALFAPERVDHLVAMSVGHPATFRAGGFEQHEKSWYMLLFQFAGIAEEWLSADDWANFRAWSEHPDADATIAALERNESLTPGLNYYRANVPPESYLRREFELPPVQAPTMGVWSSGDSALGEGQMTRSAAGVAGPWRYERVDGAAHWMQLEAPDAVNGLLVDFLPA
jgi:pimeloyl-ACP methyl ester carboxylesterase